MLDRQLLAHNVRGAEGVSPGGGVKIHLSKIPRLELSGGSTKEDFRRFKCQWDQYIREYMRSMKSGSETSSPCMF